MKSKLFFLILGLSLTHTSMPLKIGFCMVATNKYICFTKPLIESCRKFFLPEHQKTFFVFSDTEEIVGSDLFADIKKSFGSDVIFSHQEHMPWPYPTLKRFEIYARHAKLFEDMDYIFAIDSDMRFVGVVENKVLSDLVGTRHPGFLTKKGPREQNKLSTAYERKFKNHPYFCGGFYGGKKENFLNLCKQLANNVNQDLKNKIIAVWRDETHLNAYFSRNPPTRILTSSYCYPENQTYPGLSTCKPILLAIYKKNEFLALRKRN